MEFIIKIKTALESPLIIQFIEKTFDYKPTKKDNSRVVTLEHLFRVYLDDITKAINLIIKKEKRYNKVLKKLTGKEEPSNFAMPSRNLIALEFLLLFDYLIKVNTQENEKYDDDTRFTFLHIQRYWTWYQLIKYLPESTKSKFVKFHHLMKYVDDLKRDRELQIFRYFNSDLHKEAIQKGSVIMFGIPLSEDIKSSKKPVGTHDFSNFYNFIISRFPTVHSRLMTQI